MATSHVAAWPISRQLVCALLIATPTILITGPALAAGNTAVIPQPVLGMRSATPLTLDGLEFKDLNHNGRLDPYEDWRLSPAERAADLLGRMTLEEKAATLMHSSAPGIDSVIGHSSKGYDDTALEKLIGERHITSFITRLSVAPESLARENNSIQEIAEAARLGIPLSISSDPRNHFQSILGASAESNGFSQWPELLGLAATADPETVRRFADIARQEYRATGIDITLSPQADLATEPRWPRLLGTFGEDPKLAKALVAAYVAGFQHGAQGVDTEGVAAVVKHWVGYGAEANNGFDAHNYYGRQASFTGGHFQDHIEPFEGAFAQHVAGIMPTYAILQGVKIHGRALEPVGAGFNHQLLTELLRQKYHFDGIVLSDWAITNDCDAACTTGIPAQQPKDIGMPWGVESLSMADRFIKAFNAGIDQFGGTERSEYLVSGVRSGRIQLARLDASVRRILILKFQQGLFENPYSDPDVAHRVVGNPTFADAALDAQRRSVVLLQNEHRLLPLSGNTRVYLYGIDAAEAGKRNLTVVKDPGRAEIAIVRLTAPHEPLHPGFFFGSRQHEGSLAFADGNPEYEQLKTVSAQVPTVAVVFLDRPAILTNIRDKARAVIGDFGVSDGALLDVLTGRAHPQGRLPLELPSSMAEVVQQKPDAPADTKHPLYAIGAGLKYP
jgi:beta-glucosidase